MSRIYIRIGLDYCLAVLLVFGGRALNIRLLQIGNIPGHKKPSLFQVSPRQSVQEHFSLTSPERFMFWAREERDQRGQRRNVCRGNPVVGLIRRLGDLYTAEVLWVGNFDKVFGDIRHWGKVRRYVGEQAEADALRE